MQTRIRVIYYGVQYNKARSERTRNLYTLRCSRSSTHFAMSFPLAGPIWKQPSAAVVTGFGGGPTMLAICKLLVYYLLENELCTSDFQCWKKAISRFGILNTNQQICRPGRTHKLLIHLLHHPDQMHKVEESAPRFDCFH